MSRRILRMVGWVALFVVLVILCELWFAMLEFTLTESPGREYELTYEAGRALTEESLTSAAGG